MGNEAMDWNSPIEDDGQQFVILPEDTEVDCTVIEFEQAFTTAGAPMAKLRIKCVAAEGKTIVDENLALQKNCEWKLCEFFTALGQRVHGQRIVPDWEKVLGAKFRAVLKKEPWKSNPDKFNNKIKRYLEPVLAADAGGEPSFG